MHRKPVKKSLSSIPREDAHGGAGMRQVLFDKSENFVSPQFEAMTKGFLPPGASYDWHEHKNVDELFIVMEGKGVVEYADGSRFDYESGDVFYSPAGLSHRLINTDGKDSVFFFIRLKA